MKAYRYELLAVVFVLLGSILFSIFGIAETGTTMAETRSAEPNSEMVSLK